MRDAAINLRALPGSAILIDHAASLLAEIVLTSCWRPLATGAKPSSCSTRCFFALDLDKFRRFTDMLDAPPESANPGLNA